LRARQVVSGPHSIVCAPRFPGDFLALCLTEGECYMLADLLSLLWHHYCTQQFVSATFSCAFYPRQDVSSPLLLALFHFPDDTLALPSRGCEPPSAASYSGWVLIADWFFLFWRHPWSSFTGLTTTPPHRFQRVGILLCFATGPPAWLNVIIIT
jgi:hypothetical protein